METELNVDYFAQNFTELSNSSNLTTEAPLIDENNTQEIVRLVHVIVRPILIIGGTVGNILTLYITRRPSLKHLSTCFYMFLLAVADTSKLTFFNVPDTQSKFTERILAAYQASKIGVHLAVK